MTGDVSRSDGGKFLAPHSSDVDFAIVLSRTIESLKSDPSQLRSTIYELARVKLQRAAWERDPPLSILEMRRLMLSLETAIERVETYSARQDEVRALQMLDRLIEDAAPQLHEDAAPQRPEDAASRLPAIAEIDPALIIDPPSLVMNEASRPPAFLLPAERVRREHAPTWSRMGAAPM